MSATLFWSLTGLGTVVASILKTVRYKMKINAIDRSLGRGDHFGATIMACALVTFPFLNHAGARVPDAATEGVVEEVGAAADSPVDQPEARSADPAGPDTLDLGLWPTVDGDMPPGR